MTDESEPPGPGGPRYKVLRASRRKRAMRIVAATLIVGAGTAAVLYPVLESRGIVPTLETSEPQEFQQGEQGSAIGRVEVGQVTAEAPAPRAPEFDPGPIEDALEAQRLDLESRNARLQDDVGRLQAELRDLAGRPATSDGSAEVASAMQEMQRQNAALLRQLQAEIDNRVRQSELDTGRRLAAERSARETDRDLSAQRNEDAAALAKAASDRQEELADLIRELQDDNRNLSERMRSGLDGALAQEAEARRQADLEAARRADLEVRQEELRARREAQIRSEGVIYDAGGSTGGGGAPETVPAGSAGGGRNAGGGRMSPDQAGRAFLLEGALPTTVSQAEIIANPGDTVLQGTMIAATMETALDSGLPGPVTAVVSTPVWSFDQSRILIPQGSRLFGSYSSDVSIGQARVLVAWNRIVTPDGQSVRLAAFGTDSQGRSGVTGKVNSRFGTRFGSAALLSIIGAAPAIAAASIDDDVAREVGSRVSDDFADATNVVIGQYASLPPIISVPAGSSIMVIVDRDLEFFR